MKSIFKPLILSLTFFIYSFCSNAHGPPTAIANALQNITDNALPSQMNNSGVVLGIHVPGEWSWQGASGYAISGATSGQPAVLAQPNSKFRTGSITKTMVATCILKLEENGLLNTEDPIDNFLRSTLVNDTISSSGTLKIRHLLNHTSGISNSADNPTCQSTVLNNPLTSWSLEEAIYCGASQGEIFPPEFAWGYSNTNYSILAMIIEEVTGVSYENYLLQNIINPLNLQNTEIPSNPQINGNHMGCYWNIGSWVDLTIIHPSTYTGWADVVSTTEDLNIFYSNLLEGNLISNSSLTKMKTIDPASFDYGFGLDFYLLGGNDYYGHSGEVANTSCMFFADVSTALAPNGYYISFNFNMQGADMYNSIEWPVYNLLNSGASTAIEPLKTIEYKLYPNPTKDMVYFQHFSNEKGSCNIIDLQGKLINSYEIKNGMNSIDCSHLEKGIYTIKFITNDQSSNQKLIIQ